MSDVRPTVYLETSVVSYLVAEPSVLLVTLAHQHITTRWWAAARPLFDCYVSQYVLEEIAQGDAKIARRRWDAVKDIGVLAATDDVVELAAIYADRLGLTGRALADVPHFAYSVAHKVEYLLTWNCSHIANGLVIKRLAQINHELGLATPVVLTPEELMADENVDD
jgi:hypothetical protein